MSQQKRQLWHKISFAPALASQSAYTLFGRAASTGVPSFLASIDSNFIPTLHSEGYYNTKYITASSTVTLTNKRWTARVGSTTSSATPTINTDNYDIYKLTAQTTDITSFTTNLSGTPVDGDILEIQITGTATRAITWGSSFVSSTVTLPATTSSTATLSVILQYYTTSSYGTNKWVCVNYYWYYYCSLRLHRHKARCINYWVKEHALTLGLIQYLLQFIHSGM